MTSALVSESISSLLSWPVGNLMNNDAIILEADRNLDEAIKKMLKLRNKIDLPHKKLFDGAQYFLTEEKITVVGSKFP